MQVGTIRFPAAHAVVLVTCRFLVVGSSSLAVVEERPGVAFNLY